MSSLAGSRAARCMGAIGFALMVLATSGCDERALSVHEAARSGDAAQLRKLILKGARGNELEEALVIAASAGHTDVVGLLIRSGVDPEVRQLGFDFTALGRAVGRQHMETAKLLMRSGANADVRARLDTVSGDPILVTFALLDDVEAVRLAVDAGARLDLRSEAWSGSRTALQVAASRGNMELVQFLLDAGASSRGAVPHAAGAGHRDVVALLLRSGADPDAALTVAAAANRLEVVDLLLSMPDIGNIHVALERAAYKGHSDMVVTLLNAGANANFGVGPAAYNRRRAVLDRLLSASGADASFGIVQAAMIRSAKTIELLLAHGADPDFRCSDLDVVVGSCVADEEGVSAMMFAISGGRAPWQVIWQRTLIGGHSEVFGIGALPLDAFDMSDRVWFDGLVDDDRLDESGELVQIVEMLLEAGADTNLEDRLGQTALMRAAGFGFANVTALLIHGGADVNHRDRTGMTALEFATRELEAGRETLLFRDRLANVAKILSRSGGVGGGA